MPRIGKVALVRRAEEVAECNGKQGRPGWISWGSQVFDVTKFVPKNNTERTELQKSAGGPISRTLKRSTQYSKDLYRRLKPYMCGHLDLPLPPRAELRPFTPRLLRWYDNPGAGCYAAVNKKVYDLTGKLLART